MSYRLRGSCATLISICVLIDIAVSWTASSNSNTIRRLPSIHQFDPAEFYANGSPLLIANFLSPQELETCTESIMSRHGSTVIELQHQIDGVTEGIYETTLEKATKTILYDSSVRSNSSYLAFCEGLAVPEHNTNSLLFPNDDPDWFTEYFPTAAQPTDAVIFSGIGATSTLHRDPFEWLGTNLCLEGSKLWRMVHPNANDDRIVQDAYRLESVAWGETGHLSAGWQSDSSLFQTRRQPLPTMEDLMNLEYSDKMKYFTRIGRDPDIIVPDDSLLDVTFSTILQQEGDLLLIPSQWWHQTMALEPSVAIASQRCGKHEAPQVLRHMLDWNGISETMNEVDEMIEKHGAQESVDAVLKRIASLKQPCR